jgi:hypothetical protein
MLVTYFKFNPLGFEFGIPAKPTLLPHLGLTKNESQCFSGYPVRPPGFSSCRRHGYIPAERIHVHVPGHTGRIPGSYLRDKSRHSSFIAITQLENLISQPSFWLIKSKNFELKLTSSNSLPMGVVSLHVVDYIVKVCMISFLHPRYWLSHPLSGAHSALPMGVAPEAMFEYL